jgi:hypothetical protein
VICLSRIFDHIYWNIYENICRPQRGFRPDLSLKDRLGIPIPRTQWWLRPDPDFLPPPEILFSVAHARRLASVVDTPRFS